MLPKPLPEYGNLDDYGNWGDLAGDERWKRITPRIILTHSTGFANFSFVEPDGKLKFHFDPGRRYAYSGEGIILLQFAIEKGLGIDARRGHPAAHLHPFGMTKTSLMWRPDFAANLADGWMEDGKVEPHDERSRVRAAGSMDTSVADLPNSPRFIPRVGAEAGVTRRMLSAPQLPITSRSQFPTLAPEAAAQGPLAGPRGGAWSDHASTGRRDALFEGRAQRQHRQHDGVRRGQAPLRACCMSNDVRAEKAFPWLIRSILGDTGFPHQWEYQGSSTALPKRP